MNGKMSLEEGLARGIVLTAEQADTVIEALTILRDHASGIRNSGRPGSAEAADIVSKMLIPVGEMLVMMFESGMVAPRKAPESEVERQIMELLEPDPWGQAGGQ
jgi:hypothetical protein